MKKSMITNAPQDQLRRRSLVRRGHVQQFGPNGNFQNATSHVVKIAIEQPHANALAREGTFTDEAVEGTHTNMKNVNTFIAPDGVPGTHLSARPHVA